MFPRRSTMTSTITYTKPYPDTSPNSYERVLFAQPSSSSGSSARHMSRIWDCIALRRCARCALPAASWRRRPSEGYTPAARSNWQFAGWRRCSRGINLCFLCHSALHCVPGTLAAGQRRLAEMWLAYVFSCWEGTGCCEGRHRCRLPSASPANVIAEAPRDQRSNRIQTVETQFALEDSADRTTPTLFVATTFREDVLSCVLHM